MDRASVDDAAALIQRANVLEACREGPVGRSTIADRADCSRTTAYRATADLEDRGLIERANGGYRLTGSGAAMLDHLGAFRTKLAGTSRIQPLFDFVDSPALVEQAHQFADAELVVQDPAAPYHIETRLQSVIDDTETEMWGMTTGLGSPALAEAMFERIEAGVDVEWVLPADTYDHFVTEYGTLSAHAVDDEQTTVHTRDAIPLDLAVYDETLVVIGFDHERGVIGAVALTDEPDALRWARERFADCRRDASRVE